MQEKRFMHSMFVFVAVNLDRGVTVSIFGSLWYICQFLSTKIWHKTCAI